MKINSQYNKSLEIENNYKNKPKNKIIKGGIKNEKIYSNTNVNCYYSSGSSIRLYTYC